MLKKLRSPLYLALLLPALLALYGDGLAPLDHVFLNARSKLGKHETPPSIVVVSIDSSASGPDTSTTSSRKLASALEAVRRQIPYRVFIDAPVNFGQDKVGDAELVAAVNRLAPDAAFVVRHDNYAIESSEVRLKDFRLPDAALSGSVPMVLSSWDTNFFDYALSSPYSFKFGDKTYPTFAAALTQVDSGWQSSFRPDYLLNPDSILKIRASALDAGNFKPGLLTGRTVIVTFEGTVAPLGLYGSGRRHPLDVDIAGASALKQPLSLSLNGLPLLFLVWYLIWKGSQSKRKSWKTVWHGSALVCVFLIPAVAQTAGILVKTGASLVAVAIYGFSRMWQYRIRRVQLTSASGLPNLLALSATPMPVGQDLIVALIARYEEILATLPKDLHGECARQIARRLSVGSGASTVYNGEGGHFAWAEEARPLEMQLDHLEGLRALFSAPLEIGPYTFDTNVHFGLDRNEGFDALTRVNSALASANDALAGGRAIELFEADRLADASWELSLHARIDEGLRNGEIWLAFQSQWDSRTGSICGAEALIRWNHPTRGPIPPDAFILQAERAGRIDALTYWTMEEAITAALALNAAGQRFQMSINLSAQMVDKPGLVSSITEIIKRRGIDPTLLTIEITETSSVRNRPAAVANLSKLRSLGFRLSIDDFGTGEASLAYLADLPSDELKLDRRFISRILTHERELKIVQSTIDLAHALGQVVVAEGIEDEATWRKLIKLGCDIGQGYHLGRPMPFVDFQKIATHAGTLIRESG
ncbi:MULTISPECIES: EAL domain-containing protein [unclassified Novosphingobium]|uniref:EAL domain-containing protein n=1 Tax=unclassified Novosphingobium TaxID=2644732 RepID=UPI0025CC4FAD|nr:MULTISPECIES: EAL domain-containing protein [unclassified Novosphingobium]